MTIIDLVHTPRDHMMTFLRRANELAVSDFNSGIRGVGSLTGQDVMKICGVSHHHDFQETLALSVYDSTIQSLVEAQD